MWSNLNSKSINFRVREVLFLFIHNKIPTKERLFRINLANDPYCDFCLDANIGPFVSDAEHVFCTCLRVCEVWSEIRVKLANYISVDIINTDLIGLRFTNNTFSNELTWVVGSYIYAVWNSLHVKGDSFLNRDSFFGFHNSYCRLCLSNFHYSSCSCILTFCFYSLSLSSSLLFLP